MTAARQRVTGGAGGAGTPPRPPPQGQVPAGVQAAQAAQLGAAALLAIESRVRAARDETELVHLIANELRKLVGGRQAIVLRANGAGRMKVMCVSSLVLTEKETPFVHWIEGMAARLRQERGEAEAVEFELPAFAEPDSSETRTYPFPHFVWQPMRLVTGEVFAGLLIARERIWGEQERRIVAREADVFASAWQALHGARPLRPRTRRGRSIAIVAGLLVVVAAFLPVPMTALAPVEIVARQPQRVTAPIDGVIKEILVEPNRAVKKGEALLRFDETMLRNRLQVAEQEMLVARARFERASQAAFSDDKARHELALARAELDLKQAERDYARELLQRSIIHAERNGVLVYADKDRWIGRPVRTGERIMQIVDPADFAARIELPVADAIVLERGARIRMFLDADPLSAIPAHLESEGYHAEPNSTQQLVYRLHARVDDRGSGLRIGARGMAQMQGDSVLLIYYLLRRPISAVRQHLGI